MINLPIYILIACIVAVLLYVVLRRNRKDERDLEKSLDLSEEEDEFRFNKRPGEKEEL